MKFKPLVAPPALAVVLALAACAGALESPTAHATSVVGDGWPPVWQDAPPSTQADFTTPRFAPPTANHCRRPPGLREVAGGGREQAVGRAGRAGGGERLVGAAEAPPLSDAATGAARTAESSEVRDADRAAKSSPGLPLAARARVDASADRHVESALAAAPAERDERRRADSTTAFPAAPALQGVPVPSSAPWPKPMPQRPAHEAVTAGVVDDNADFGEYLAFRQRRAGLPVRERDVSERHLLEVTDARGRPVHDAEVAVQRPGVAQPVMWARTDTAGRVWLHPRAFTEGGLAESGSLGVAVRKNGVQGRAVLLPGQANAVQVRLASDPAVQRPRLDLVFMIDATGSMGDEIAKLKASMRAMSQQISQLPGQPDICYGLVAYRDRGDAFITRTHDFTDDLGAFQQVLARVQAGGGGDTPEALNEALHEVVHHLNWRADAARMVVMVADAPPHLDYGGPQYDKDTQAALAKGIKLFAVGASGLDPVGEYVFRQIAQYTAGRFVFLTYKNAAESASGPGTQTVHDVKQYSVQTLDRLVVRLVSEEMARLPRS